MPDFGAIDFALRDRAFSLLVASTGSTSLAATTNGYTRSAGSFVTDGFSVGMEVLPFGFSSATPSTVLSVSALTLTTTTTQSAQAETSGRSLTVALPPLRFAENVAFDSAAVVGRHYVELDFVPATQTLRTLNAQQGIAELTGLYVIRWYGVPNTGTVGLRACLTALAALFTPGTVLTATPDNVRIRGDISTFPSPIRNTATGIPFATLTIPWRVLSTNVIQ